MDLESYARQLVSWRRKWSRIEARPDDTLDRAVPDMADTIARCDERDLYTDVGFVRGSSQSIDITVAPASQQRRHVRCPGCDGTTVTRTSDGMRVTVNSFTYSRAVLTRIAASIVATPDPAHWWTVRGAFG